MGWFRRQLRTVRNHHWSDERLAVTLILTSLVVALLRIGRIIIGEKPAFDFRTAWRPISEAVHSGSPLYLGTADNKPPLFHGVNLLTGLFDHHAFVFILLIGLVNGVGAVLLWRLLGQYGRPKTGFIGAVLFLFFAPAFKAHFIQAGSFAVTFVLLALLTHRPAVSGIFAAIAGLFYQYVILVVPAVLLVQLYRTERPPFQWGAFYVSGGLLTVAVVFGIVGMLWSPQSALAGLHWSYGVPTGVTSVPIKSYIDPPGKYAGRMWLLHDRCNWVKHGRLLVGRLLPLFIPIGVTLTTAEWRFDSESFETHALLLAVAACLPLLVRTYADYAVLALPFFCVLAAAGIERLVRGEPLGVLYRRS